MIWTLIQKDAFRISRNPWGVILQLAIPLMITGLIGSLFGPKSSTGGVPTIKVAVVDEDKSALGGTLLGALDRETDSKRYFAPIPTTRDQADTMIRNDEVSAVLILPKDFTKDFLTGGTPAPIELIKNPSQAFLPLIMEELTSVVAETLNVASQTLAEDMKGFVQELEEDDLPDFLMVAKSIEKIGKKFEQAEKILTPPLIQYGIEKRAAKKDPKKEKFQSNIFGFLLPGLAAMFLLFIADGSSQELYKERESRTLDRIRSFNNNVLPFLISKGLYTLLLTVTSGIILFGVGSAIFRIQWQHPWIILLLLLAYAFFSTGFITALAALMKTQKRAAIVNNVLIMMMAFLGGSMMTSNALPDALAQNVCPLFPNYWFTESIKNLEFGIDGPGWVMTFAKLMVLGAVFTGISTSLFNRLLTKGSAS